MRKTPSLVSLVFGFLGVVLVIAGITATWVLSARMRESAAELFKVADATLTVVHDRISQVEAKVKSLKVIAEDFQPEFAEESAGAERQKRRETLENGLVQADRALEVTESRLILIGKTMKVGAALGAASKHQRMADLTARIAVIRRQIVECLQAIDTVSDNLTSGEIREQLQNLSERLVVRLTSVESGLALESGKIVSLQKKLRDAGASILQMIRIIAIVATGLGVWMGAGQISLLRRGWQGLSSDR